MSPPPKPSTRGRLSRRPPLPSSPTHLGQGQAIEFISSRDMRKGDTERSCRDRTSHLVDDAVASGALDFSGPSGLPIAEVVAWARTKKGLKLKFPDFPVVSTSIQPGTAFGTARANQTPPIPESLSACQDALRDALSEVDRLRQEVAALRPLADRQRARAEANRRSASKPRSRG